MSIKQHKSRFCRVLLHLPLKVQIPIEYNFQLKVTLSSCLIRSGRQCLSRSTTANLAHDEHCDAILNIKTFGWNDFCMGLLETRVVRDYFYICATKRSEATDPALAICWPSSHVHRLLHASAHYENCMENREKVIGKKTFDPQRNRLR